MDPLELSIPEALAPRYRPLRKLGGGGFGRVMLAQDTRLDRPVAIKVMRASLPDLELRLRFEREARITARLQHPHIVRVYDFGIGADGIPYIVYEFVEGRSLADPAPPGPTSAAVRGYGVDLAGALSEAHRAGVLHRDVKPENVLVRASGAVVLCDFGIARVAAGATVQTRQGIVMGTPEYMAPELFRAEPPSPASDQFALAATLFRLAYRDGVYGAADLAGILRRAESGTGGRIPAAHRGADPVLEAALVRALAPEPRARFPDLDAFGAALAGGAACPEAAGPRAAPTVLLAPAPGPGSSTRELGPRVPGVRRGGPALLALGAGILLWGLVRWGGRGGGEPPGPGTPGPALVEGPVGGFRPSPEAAADELGRKLCGTLGRSPGRYPWLVLEAMVRDSRDPDGARVLAALDGLPPSSPRDCVRLECLQARGGEPAASMARAMELFYRDGIGDWVTARARIAGLSIRMLHRDREPGTQGALVRELLETDLAWVDRELARPGPAWRLAMRAEFWDMLGRRLHPRPTLNLPALEMAERLIGALVPRLDELGPDEFLVAAVMIQRVTGQLGDARRTRLAGRLLGARALAPLADVPEAAEVWERLLYEYDRTVFQTEGLAQRAVPLDADPTGLPLPREGPGWRRHRAGQPWALVDDPAGPGPVRVDREAGRDPREAFRAAGERAALAGRELADDPGLRTALLAAGEEATGGLLLWPGLMLGHVRELAAAGRKAEALRLARRSLGARTVERGPAEQLRRFGAGPWAELELWTMAAEAADEAPESQARARAKAREIVVRTLGLGEPLTRGEARVFAAAWPLVDKAGLGARVPEGEALARAVAGP